jgi:aspartate/methionine/tyrosine aminotransferase
MITGDEILVTFGGKGFMWVLYSVLADKGAEAIILGPEFWGTHQVVMEGLGYSVGIANSIDDLIKKISRKTKIVVIISPSNPSNKVVEQDQIEEVIKKCRKTKTILFLDAVYRVFNKKAAIVLNSDYDLAIQMWSAAKAWSMPENRIGYGIVKNKELMEKLRAYEEQYWSNHVRFLIAAAGMMASDPSIDPYERALKESILKRQRMMNQDLEKVFLEVNQDPGMYVWVNAENYIGKKGVIKNPLDGFKEEYAGGRIKTAKDLQYYFIQWEKKKGIACVSGFNTKTGLRLSTSMNQKEWKEYFDRMQAALEMLR